MKNGNVKVNHLVKKYDTNLVIDDISFSIQKPGVYLLAGPNGSGKTTLLEIIAGLRQQNSGQVWINGCRNNSLETKKNLGFLCQQNSLRKNIKVCEEIQLVKDLYNLTIDEKEYLKKYSLETYYKQKSKNLSGGTKRRLLIAMLLMAGQNIVLLDEPASGLDTNNRDEIWNIIQEYGKENIVIVSDHYLNQAALYSDYIYFINKGKIIAEDTVANIREGFRYKKLIKVRKEIFHTVQPIIKEICMDYAIKLSGTVYNIFINSNIADVQNALKGMKVTIHDIDMEDIYFYYTGKYEGMEGTECQKH